MRSSSPRWRDSQFSILMTLSGAGELLELARLGQIAMHQLQVLGLLQRIITVGCLVAVGDHVAGQGAQHIVRHQVARNGGHASERAKRAGDVDGLFGGFGLSRPGAPLPGAVRPLPPAA